VRDDTVVVRVAFFVIVTVFAPLKLLVRLYWTW
jgi:hypothetical protein